jgi:trimeric autotransporter adhesin
MRKSSRLAAIALASASLAGASLIAAIGVSPAAATSATVTFTMSPSNSTGGIAFSRQPVVTLSGPGATATALVTLSVNTGPGALACTSGTTQAAVNFVASFVGCSIDAASNGYVLIAADATDGGSNTSASFNITDGPPDKLGFTTSPTSGSAGNLFIGGTIGSPVVTIEDAGGNPASSNSSDNSTVITLAISPNPGAGTLDCTNANPEVVSLGVAVFGLCAINKEGTGYTLLATASGLLAPALLPSFSSPFDVAYTTAVASQLAFTVQPAPGANVTEGTTFTLDVALEDALGNLEGNNSSTDVNLSFTGVGTFVCSGAVELTATTVDGTAIFSGCASNTSQTGMQLTAFSNNLGHVPNGISVAKSNLFNVAVQATHLVFTTEPGDTDEGVAVSPLPVVALEDAAGATATSSDLIMLTIGTNPGDGTLSCAPVAATLGAAAFPDCSISNAGVGYTLVATDETNPSTILSATSSPFDVTTGPGGNSGDGGASTHLVFTEEPGGTTTEVTVEDAGGDPITSGPGSTDVITLGIGTNPGGGALTCTPETAVAGVATFTNCTISKPGNGYTLVATDSTTTGVTPATSDAFNVGVATHLAFTAEPGNGTPGHALSEQPIVSTEDSTNGVVASSDVITLTLTTNPGSGALTCTANAVAATVGVSSFAGCAINNAGTGYVLTATDTTDGGLTPAVSMAFDVATTTPPPIQVFGQDPIGTAIAVSQAEYPNPDSANAVVLARSDFFSDALAGGPLAAALRAPLLITAGAPISTTLDPRVQAEILRALPVGDTVYMLGGPLALSTNIDAQLEALGYVVMRLYGQTEYGTAVAIAEQLGNPTTVFEATGLSFYDALSAGPAAIENHGAILLTNGTTQAPETAAYLAAHPSDTRFAIGGPLAALGADPGATGVYGQDAYGTSAAVATFFFPGANTYGLATGLNFPDALAGGVFMATGGRLGPILLVNPSVLPPLEAPVAAYLATLVKGTQGYVFGGPLAIPAAVLADIQAAVG